VGTTEAPTLEEEQFGELPKRSLAWRLVHSWWLVLGFLSSGLLSWVGFGYLGARVHRRRWLGWGALYLAAAAAALSLLAVGGSTNSTLEDVVGLFIWLGLWGGSLVHGLLIRREALLRLSVEQELRGARARELESRLARQYAQQRISSTPTADAAETPVTSHPAASDFGSEGEPAPVPVEPASLTAIQTGAYASWGRRFGAWVVDVTVLSVVLVPIWVLAALGVAYSIEGPVDRSTTDGALAAVVLGFPVVALLALLYYTVLQGGKRGQTLGKFVFSIRLRRAGGSFERVGYLRAALRTLVIFLFWSVGSLPFLFVPPILIDALWPLWDERKQALHDKVCGTVVVRAS
jgi:uncharacterized RDD family membrane protein YckC